MGIESFRISEPITFECDVLIIGSGPGGAVTACELVAHGLDVLMLEEGPASDSSQSISSAKSLQKFWRNNGLTAALGRTPVSYAEGRCVGGGSEINSAIIQRTPGNLLDQWAKDYDIQDFGGAALAPYYDKAIKAINARINSGPPNPLSQLMINGAAALNWKVSALERSDDAHGKRSMSATLLRKALTQGLRLVSECRVNKIIFKGKQAISIKATAEDVHGRKHSVIVFFKDIFIAAGAVHTPALLLRSGIKKNIGRTLRLHPTLKALAHFPQLIEAHKHVLAPHAVTEFMPDIRLGCSVFRPGFFGMSLAEDWQHRAHLEAEIDHCAIYYAMIRAQGVGRIYSIAGLRDPLVTFKLTGRDWDLLRRGLLALSQLLFAAGATEIFPSITGHSGWRRDQLITADPLIENLPANANPFTIHIFSSCPMGGDKERCATNSFGKIYDLENTYIADASLIPEAPGVNPQATIMAIAERNVQHFLKLRG
ncbi:FAD-dependent oxidoreductase [Polynucleobacter sp. Tro8-14-1]|uniref:FAD-dependent oxidoreductase n=1 Tax=Polynucleobacter sp. Tro8-14-1 TaxID=1758383 RepID=UPI001C0BF411|nr:GMC family oxidoreductase [Polynucleobacter sp. Tro8-14-1]MBU3563634.1 GMC family oxidoreductase [Polynucleobacter sp. Tro8-14-1]